MKNKYNVIVIGGGASGFFTAIRIKEEYPNLSVVILERGKDVLSKVKISGGGRCNVTHAEFIPNELTKNYPRGEKELLGPFHQFMTGDMIGWFETNGVALKTEEDGRMFPVTDDSQTIIDCFIEKCSELAIEIKTLESVQKIAQNQNSWQIETKNNFFCCQQLVIASGSNPKIWNFLQENLNQPIVEPVPSLFTFNTKEKLIEGLAGISTHVNVKVLDTDLEENGPLLITHWGFSGPSILRLSAWGAKVLAAKNYQFRIEINWTNLSEDEVLEELMNYKNENPKQQILTNNLFDIPKRLWRKLMESTSVDLTKKWADLSKKELLLIQRQLTRNVFHIQGKSTFKEEFVTAGGIDLKTVNFKTMESKLHQNLFYVGETLNIDAITGGFNFQNAWTTAYIAAKEIASRF
ncbi:NAD(P)/FAD-dependent oxidoreductase [Mesonia sp. K7]|uniref:NAD(P)/FAD-dependent oxidoreductase n=1 Tax=Mesonia sp. K7 TaxID=2218606 RepID=UPI000DAAC2CE|nr:NAD(P)/FAD-dependent oxidoreductase [Mesonia sp. K7]PZD79608.1 aminoacetone oxidase family FAD-binding enzyme [Mesonia sp. K7]